MADFGIGDQVIIKESIGPVKSGDLGKIIYFDPIAKIYTIRFEHLPDVHYVNAKVDEMTEKFSLYAKFDSKNSVLLPKSLFKWYKDTMKSIKNNLT